MGYQWASENSLRLVTTNAMIDIQLTTPHETKYLQYFISTPKPISNTTGFPYTHGNHLPSYGMAPETKPDHTEHHLTAILLIASIFAFLTLGIMGTFLVFYKKKNAVFALQKCEEDSDDNNFELDDLDLTQISFSDTESVQELSNMGMRRSNTCSDLQIENEITKNIPRAKTISSIKDISSISVIKSSKKKKKERRNSSSKSGQYKPLVVTAVLEARSSNSTKHRRKSEGCLNPDIISDQHKQCVTLGDYSRLHTAEQNKDIGIHSSPKSFAPHFQDTFFEPTIQTEELKSDQGNIIAIGSDYNIYHEDNTFQQISGKLSIDIHSILPDNQNETLVTTECEEDPESEQLLSPQAEHSTNLSSLPQRFYRTRNFFENSSC